MKRVPLRLLAALVTATACLPTACMTREVKNSLLDRPSLVVFLRSHKQGFTTVEKGFSHPARISEDRLMNILGAIDIRGREEKLAGIRSALAPDLLPEIAKQLSAALGKASPDEEVAVISVRKESSSYAFNRKFISNFVAYVDDELLYLHFSLIDSPVEARVKKTSLPEPRINDHPMRFRVIPAPGMYAEGVYAVSVEWQDDLFRRPLRRAGGKGRRERTILMEEPDLPEKKRRNFLPSELLPYLTPDQLRQLADLEEARNQGELTEGRYRREREKILSAAQEAADDDDSR